jgi:hypothetical protein
MVLADFSRYDSAWTSVLSDATTTDESWPLDLVQMAATLSKRYSPGIPHQRTARGDAESNSLDIAAVETDPLPRMERSKSLHINSLSSVLKSTSSFVDYFHVSWNSTANGHSQLIVSLDQLYTQALCLHPILLSKVLAWADVSNGYFRCSVQGQGQHFVHMQAVVNSNSRAFEFAKVIEA